MAPEGTRFEGVGIGEFKLGAFYLALRARQPIVPVCVYGTQDILPKGTLRVNPGEWKKEVDIRILKPIKKSSEDSSVTRAELRDCAREALLEEFYRIHNSSENRRLGMKTEKARSPSSNMRG